MAKDILLNEDNSLIIRNGDFVIGNSDEQHIRILLQSNKGDIKPAPLAGVGLIRYVSGPFSPEISRKIEREIRLQLEVDGASNVAVRPDKDGWRVAEGEYL